MGASATEYDARDLSSDDVVAVMPERASKEPSPTTRDAVYAKLISSVQTSVSTGSHAHSHAAMSVASHTQNKNNLLTPPYRSTPHPHAPSQGPTNMLHAVTKQLCQFPVLAIMFTCTLSGPVASGAPLPAAQPPENAPWHWLEPVIGASSAIAAVFLAAFLGWAIESFRNRRRRSATIRQDGVLVARMPPRPLLAAPLPGEAARVQTEYWSVFLCVSRTTRSRRH